MRRVPLSLRSIRFDLHDGQFILLSSSVDPVIAESLRLAKYDLDKPYKRPPRKNGLAICSR